MTDSPVLQALLARHAAKEPQLGAAPQRLMSMGQAEALLAGLMGAARNGQWANPQELPPALPQPMLPAAPQLGAQGVWGRGAAGAWGAMPQTAQDMHPWSGAAMMAGLPR